MVCVFVCLCVILDIGAPLDRLALRWLVSMIAEAATGNLT